MSSLVQIQYQVAWNKALSIENVVTIMEPRGIRKQDDDVNIGCERMKWGANP